MDVERVSPTSSVVDSEQKRSLASHRRRIAVVYAAVAAVALTGTWAALHGGQQAHRQAIYRTELVARKHSYPQDHA
jgi:hypothetical protein